MNKPETLREAIQEVMVHLCFGPSKYPEGINAGEMLAEVRDRFGSEAFPLVTVIDVADEMRSLYGRPS